jgi:hypothetical protein
MSSVPRREHDRKSFTHIASPDEWLDSIRKPASPEEAAKTKRKNDINDWHNTQAKNKAVRDRAHQATQMDLNMKEREANTAASERRNSFVTTDERGNAIDRAGFESY